MHPGSKKKTKQSSSKYVKSAQAASQPTYQPAPHLATQQAFEPVSVTPCLL